MAVIWKIAAAASLLKVLLIPLYRSTDFEVHRNWLAITHSLPVRRWYLEDTSEWTLDYPPFFAWFEYTLSNVAAYFDPKMLRVSNLNYASDATVIFQRLSVIVTDFVYIYAVSLLPETLFRKCPAENFGVITVMAMFIFNYGLLIVDHIHFQYNGILFGLLLLSIINICMNRIIEGAFWFTVLLNMKHIFLYMAPAYFFYLLRKYCFVQGNLNKTKFLVNRFLNLASVVGSLFLLSFGPFIYMGELPQVLSRLFPVNRGLLHAYWAPNFWALYTIGDKVLTITGVQLEVITNDSVPEASMTGGRVREFDHSTLPSISPLLAAAITFLAMLPALQNLWEKPNPLNFVRSLILCSFTSFMFGYHVHEKAILMVIIPFLLLVLFDKTDAKIFFILSTTGHYSLLPLLFTPQENLVKVLFLVLSISFTYIALCTYYTNKDTENGSSCQLLNFFEYTYLLGFVVLSLFNTVGLYWFQLEIRLPFLPLMLTSVYCSIGLLYCWVYFYISTLLQNPGASFNDCSKKD